MRARRRTLQLHAIAGERLGRGATLVAATPAVVSLGAVALGMPKHAKLLRETEPGAV